MADSFPLKPLDNSVKSAGYSLTDDVREKLFKAVNESISIAGGRGGHNNISQTLLSRHDRFGNSVVQLNNELIGLTFFTRPRFNLTTESLRQDPILAMLDTIDPASWMFSLRCNLDSVFARSPEGRNAAAFCPWFNDTSPFNVPMSNLLTGINGWPDFSVEYKTTESGYFSENMTLARGSDWGRQTYDLSCTFRDIQGGYLMSYFYYWLLAIALQMDGTIVAYPDDRDANRLNYTCSIYRFVLDPSMTTITKWAKATGCFPVSVPLGDVFNFSPGDSHIHTSQQFNINFKANNIRYMDPRHLKAFNTLVERYTPDIVSKDNRQKTRPIAEQNFTGLPYIDLFSGNNELAFYAEKEELVNTSNQTIEDIKKSVQAQMAASLKR